MTTLKSFAPSDHDRQQHELPEDHVVVGHRVVVSGVYFAKAAKRDAAGAAQKVKKPYREEFFLEPHQDNLRESNALSRILGGPLQERLRTKDKDFRGVQTHEVVEHENRLEKVAVPPAEGQELEDPKEVFTPVG